MPDLQVAVIGAGAAGLVTARELLRRGHRVVVFEQGAGPGGVWVYSDDAEDDPLGLSGTRIHGSLYASLRTNLPRDLMAFIDYPFDASGGGEDDWPRFPGHRLVLAYLQNFARAFGLEAHMRCGVRVASVRRGDGWVVESVSGEERRSERFDALAVCNGHYSEPRVPPLAGLAGWPGTVMHSHNYRTPAPFAGKRVAVFGASASGVDLSAEIAGVAEAVFWCAEAFAQLPSGERGAPGGVRRLPGIEALHEDGGVILQDGSRLDEVDVLVFCTGYHYRYPFLGDLIRVDDNWVAPLYQDLLHVNHPSLCFVGIPFRVVPFPLFEMQAQWFARLLQGEFDLPSKEAMLAHTDARIAGLRAAGTRQRHFHQRRLDCYDYLDELADQAGAPRLPVWHRQLTAALLAHVAADPRAYRDRPFGRFAPTRVPD
jgi:hypothetical protein